MSHNLFYNITLTDDSNRDRDHLRTHTFLNTWGSYKLSTPTRKKQPTSINNSGRKRILQGCQILFPMKYFVIAYFSTDRGILLLYVPSFENLEHNNSRWQPNRTHGFQTTSSFTRPQQTSQLQHDMDCFYSAYLDCIFNLYSKFLGQRRKKTFTDHL